MTQQQTQQMQQQPRDFDTRLGVVESTVSDLRTLIQDLSRDLKARGSINWAPVNIMLAVVTVLGGMFFTWANSNTSRLETLIGKVDLRTDRYLPREELDMRFATYGQRRDDLQRLTDARIERVERDVEGVQKQLVPRGEHEQMWAAQRARDADLQRQTDVARKDLSDLHTPRDTIQGIQRRLDELDRESRQDRSPKR